MKGDTLMNITDWDEWMKTHHIKIYTEEELQRKRQLQTVKKATGFLKQHKTEIIKAMNSCAEHASET